MIKFFVPYSNMDLAPVSIKGHRMLFLATEESELESDAADWGWDEIREIEDSAEESEFLADLAAAIEGGVVVLPPGEHLSSVVEALQDELPWIH